MTSPRTRGLGFRGVFSLLLSKDEPSIAGFRGLGFSNCQSSSRTSLQRFGGASALEFGGCVEFWGCGASAFPPSALLVLKRFPSPQQVSRSPKKSVL